MNYGGAPCVDQLGLQPLTFTEGANTKPVKTYLHDCECEPCTNPLNAYTFTVLVPGTVALSYKSRVYALEKVVFHTGSEHAFDGVKSALEIQFLMSNGNEKCRFSSASLLVLASCVFASCVYAGLEKDCGFVSGSHCASSIRGNIWS